MVIPWPVSAAHTCHALWVVPTPKSWATGGYISWTCRTPSWEYSRGRSAHSGLSSSSTDRTRPTGGDGISNITAPAPAPAPAPVTWITIYSLGIPSIGKPEVTMPVVSAQHNERMKATNALSARGWLSPEYPSPFDFIWWEFQSARRIL